MIVSFSVIDEIIKLYIQYSKLLNCIHDYELSIRYASGTLLDFVLNVHGLGSKGQVKRITKHVAFDCIFTIFYISLNISIDIFTLVKGTANSRLPVILTLQNEDSYCGSVRMRSPQPNPPRSKFTSYWEKAGCEF